MSKKAQSSGNLKRKNKPDRLEYLDQLVVEFQTTKQKSAKEQVLANLANFAYDPFNYKYFRQLNVLDLFLDHLVDNNETLVKFSIGGLCNSCLDPVNKEYILKNSGVKRISDLLNHSNLDVVISSITTLMYLVTPESKPEITSSKILDCMIKLSNSDNTRIQNLAKIFLEDYCGEGQIEEAKTSQPITSQSLSNPQL